RPVNPFLMRNSSIASVITTAIKRKNKTFEILVNTSPSMNPVTKHATTMEIAINNLLLRYTGRSNFTLARYVYFVDNLICHVISCYTLHVFIGCKHNSMSEHGNCYEFYVFRCYEVAPINRSICLRAIEQCN